jgi:arylsulfatase A-like enzyme
LDSSPNVLVLMVDQMQARVLEADHPCQTPHLDQLARRGVRFTRAVTPNPICSPARASLMTGLLPHNHGVLTVTHMVDEDQCQLREGRPHWAQRFAGAGYLTAYFGKWHVEHSEQPSRFGWQTDGGARGALMRERMRLAHPEEGDFVTSRNHEGPPGYRPVLHYGVTRRPPGERPMGVVVDAAAQWLQRTAFPSGAPWCVFVSLEEPHDPFVAGEDAHSRYDVKSLPLPPNVHDDLAGRPALYRKSARQWRGLTDAAVREAMACYYASITEIDELFGRILAQVDAAGQADNTIVVVTSDHGELLGAHGLWTKNIMAAEECYNIPLIVSGPSVQRGTVSRDRVSSLDIGPTLLELARLPPLPDTDGRSFADLATNGGPARSRAFAEYHGGRYRLTQRVVWDDDWKLVFNGFDEDELYDLAADPFELVNRVDDPDCVDRLRDMMGQLWSWVDSSGDRSLLNSQYPPLRIARYGPDARLMAGHG